jgi:hypothetical protein
MKASLWVGLTVFICFLIIGSPYVYKLTSALKLRTSVACPSGPLKIAPSWFGWILHTVVAALLGLVVGYLFMKPWEDEKCICPQTKNQEVKKVKKVILDPNSWAINPPQPRGNLFGEGFNQIGSRDMSNTRTLSDLEQLCHSDCANDPDCKGFQWRLDERSRGQFCWFMGGPVKFVDTPNPGTGVQDGGVWIKK